MTTVFGHLSTALVILFMVSVMFSIGLEVTLTELVSLIYHRRLIVMALLVNFVFMPLVGMLLAWVFPMPASVEAGFLLLAAAPGALFAINFTRQTKGNIPIAAALLFLLTVLSLVFTPLIARALLQREDPIAFDYVRAIGSLLVFVVTPLAAGLLVRHRAEPLAKALRKPATICSVVSFVLVTIFTMAIKSAATKKIGTNGLIVMCLFIAACMVIGWACGGPERGTRQILAVNTSMRNTSLCLAIALRSFPGAHVEFPVVAFSALMLPPNLLFTIFHMRKARKLAPTQAV